MRVRFPVGLTVATAVAVAILLGLGTWQVQRLGWKRDLIARIEAARQSPPVDVVALLRAGKAGEDLRYRRATIDCDPPPPLLLYRTTGRSPGEPSASLGRRDVRFCKLPDGAPYRTLLLVGGFVSDRLALDVAGPPVENGRYLLELREGAHRGPFTPPDDPQKGQVYVLELRRLATLLGAVDPAPYLGYVVDSPACRGCGEPPPAALTNNHLGYAITWYGLAAALIGVYIALLRKRLKP